MQSLSQSAPDPVMMQMAVNAFAAQTFVADRIMPVVFIDRDSYKFPVYDASHLTDDTNVDRAIGDSANTVRFGRTYKNGTTERRALKSDVPYEIVAQNANPQSVENQRILVVANRIKIAIERKVRNKLLSLSAAATPSVKHNAASGVTIKKNVDAWKAIFRAQTGGLDPNVILLPYDVATVWSNDADIIARDKRASNEQLTGSGVLPAAVFGMETVVAGAMSKATPSASLANIWSTDDIWMLYVDPTTSANGGDVFTFGAQFRAPVEGLPIWAAKWPDPDKSAHKDWYGIEINQDENFICESCAMRINDVLE